VSNWVVLKKKRFAEKENVGKKTKTSLRNTFKRIPPFCQLAQE